MKRVLVLGAHLDDSAITMGGTIRKLANHGCEVSVYCFGNGDEAYGVPGGSAAAVTRFMESAQAAHHRLGVKHLECHDVPDFGVDATREFYQQCIKAIRKYRPDIIFGHYWAEYFQHHGMATMSRDAWNQARWDCSADLGSPWTARKYYHFEGEDPLPNPTHFVDVSDTFDIAIDALRAFDEKNGHLNETDWLTTLRRKAAFYGSKVGVEYAEAFQRSFYVRETVSDIAELF